MKLAVVIQARLGSTRLPGKVLLEVAGQPLLLYLINRLRVHPSCPPLLVATSDALTDDPVARFCERHGVAVFRGAHEDVAARFCAAVRAHRLDAFVRLSGDSPLLDPRLIDRALALFVPGQTDLVTNVFPRTFPNGQSVECLDAARYLQAYPQFERPGDFEHVTPYFYRHPERFRVVNFTSGQSGAVESLVIDTPADLAAFTAVRQAMTRPPESYTWEDSLALRRQVGAPA